MIFINRKDGTCSFDSPEFIRYLNFLKTLPTWAEYKSNSPLYGLDAEELSKSYIDGRIKTAEIYSLYEINQIRRLMMFFGTKNWTMIGYPVPVERVGAGTSVSTQNVVVITSTCDYPDNAWDFVRRCFTSTNGQGGIPSLKSVLDSMVEEWYGKQFEDYYILHDFVYTYHDMEHAITENEMEYPGTLSTFEHEDRDKYIALLDEIGTTAAEKGVPQIYEILYEEVSAFLAGRETAESCARIIQSRVSIWLAEHK